MEKTQKYSKPYVTPKQVAGTFGVSMQTVLTWIRKGSLPSMRVGGRWRIDPKDVANFGKSNIPVEGK